MPRIVCKLASGQVRNMKLKLTTGTTGLPLASCPLPCCHCMSFTTTAPGTVGSNNPVAAVLAAPPAAAAAPERAGPPEDPLLPAAAAAAAAPAGFLRETGLKPAAGAGAEGMEKVLLQGGATVLSSEKQVPRLPTHKAAGHQVGVRVVQASEECCAMQATCVCVAVLQASGALCCAGAQAY